MISHHQIEPHFKRMLNQDTKLQLFHQEEERICFQVVFPPPHFQKLDYERRLHSAIFLTLYLGNVQWRHQTKIGHYKPKWNFPEYPLRPTKLTSVWWSKHRVFFEGQMMWVLIYFEPSWGRHSLIREYRSIISNVELQRGKFGVTKRRFQIRISLFTIVPNLSLDMMWLTFCRSFIKDDLCC